MNAVKNSDFCKHFIKLPALRLGYVNAVILNYNTAVFPSLGTKAVFVPPGTEARICIHFFSNLVVFVG